VRPVFAIARRITAVGPTTAEARMRSLWSCPRLSSVRATSGLNFAPVKSLSSSTLCFGSAEITRCSASISATHSSGRTPV
jgi:hypothetical protein